MSRMDDFFETVTYVGEVQPWQDVPTLATSDDEPHDPVLVPSRHDLAEREYVRDEAGRFAEVAGASPTAPHVRGKFAEENDRIYQQLGLQTKLKKLVSSAIIAKPEPNLLAAGQEVLDVLKGMKDQGLEMPHSVLVDHTTGARASGGVRASIAGWAIRDEKGNLLGGHKKHLTVEIPDTLPSGANLDDAVSAVFGKPSEVNPKWAYKDTEYQTYDKFAARTLRDVVIHEMGHVQAGHRGDLPYGELLQRGKFGSTDAIRKAAMRVSEYALSNADEFLAESFLRQYRGEKLAPDSEKLYDALDGPPVFWTDPKTKKATP
jgi:hypothetical protein